ncbi:transcriptional regulator [Chitinophaga caeni]|uniref:Transcriptional regulator n=1 Tax=Chitinophaga caeni TaxID=2029983 RepID=A0A291QQQ8_9BACT|nr:DegT/DnrJ/EryC1/StrS family aminotransferase [Chitinophaga caeni]ATL46251.1 transcriptional regulator [Chitinophaga caeni]
MRELQMVDLKSQYNKIKEEVAFSIFECIEDATFINGPQVKSFAQNLSEYLGVKSVVPCGNGTDALQIAMMALDLQPGDEVIVPSFTYIATAEVICLLGLIPVMVDVDPFTFNIDVKELEKAITPKTRAIVPVHLFGQSVPMEEIMTIANKYGIYVIEDTAQAIGAKYTFSDGRTTSVGSIGHIGCTSFFPSKNLGCYGDGGAIFTNDLELGAKIRMIANHGQERKYVHKCIGVNSRLDSLQAAVLNVKLKYLNEYAEARYRAAAYYSKSLKGIEGIVTPIEVPFSTHVYHQYTLITMDGRRDELKLFLENNNVPSMIYYPIPLFEQDAFQGKGIKVGNLPVTTELCKSVISLPMHTELSIDQQDYIVERIRDFFKNT